MRAHRADGDLEVTSKPWPPSLKAEPASTDSAGFESAAPSSVVPNSADEMAQAMLGLLAEMEASLEGSRKAVLASNGLGLENCTREQVRLHRALELLLWPRKWPGTAAENAGTALRKDVQKKDVQAAVRKDGQKNVLSGSPRSIPVSVPRFFVECAPPLAAELLAAERRVLHGTRVQAALLRRARQFQRILTNVAAAQGAPYGAWLGSRTQF
jgi:hypothetical protein